MRCTFFILFLQFSLEGLEFEADAAIKDIVACIAALEEQGSLSGGTAAITVTELHKGVVENIKTIKGDLEVLNKEIYMHAGEQTKAVAALSVKAKALEEVNKTLSAENRQLRSDLKAVQAAIARLELAPPPSLLLIPTAARVSCTASSASFPIPTSTPFLCGHCGVSGVGVSGTLASL
ncbi:hypothetical protein B0H13DRAFT_1859020 [Mycena leptocephala]|nr:hypothetical protein B0H13DRAFT_1859020 [Mycena leptocephala]